MDTNKTNLCSKIENYFDGEMNFEDTRGFEEHLETCSACQLKLEQLKELHSNFSLMKGINLSDLKDLKIRQHLHTIMDTKKKEEEILDIEEVAVLLGVKTREVIPLLDELSAFEIGSKLRIRRDEVFKWIERQELKLSWEKEEAEIKKNMKIIKFQGGKL